MQDYTGNDTTRSTVKSSYNEGLRAYMLKIYNYMAAALCVTGVIAYATANTPALVNIIYSNTIIAYAIILAPFGIVIYLNVRMGKLSVNSMRAWYFTFAGIMGLSLSSIFIVYTQASIAKTFFITATVFASMSLYGYTTKKDLTSMGNFLIMGVFGVIIASIVNIFLKSSGLDFAISILGVLIFTGLTAYDSQKLKKAYYSLTQHPEMMAKVAIKGALILYLDFINLMLFLLRFLGDRR